MAPPVPGPRDALAVLERGAEALGELAGAIPRILRLVGEAEQLIARVDALVDRIEQTRVSADDVVTRTNAVAARTEELVSVTTPLVNRLTAMLDMTETPITRLQPALDRLSESTDPREVDALIGLIDLLPALVTHLETDVIPVLRTMGTVAPDVHELMELTRQINDMISGIPGLKRFTNNDD